MESTSGQERSTDLRENRDLSDDPNTAARLAELDRGRPGTPATAHRAGPPIPATTTHTTETGMAARVLTAHYGHVDALVEEARDEFAADFAQCRLAGSHQGPVDVTVTLGGEGHPADYTTVTAEVVCADVRCCTRAAARDFLHELQDALHTADSHLARVSTTLFNDEDPAAAWDREAVTTAAVLRTLIDTLEPHAAPRPATDPAGQASATDRDRR
ncbi:hypothetical protein [Kitasatospora sp. NPDC004272]